MSVSRMHTFDQHPAAVFDALLASGASEGLRASLLDRREGTIHFSSERGKNRYAASVTDSGSGRSVVVINWHPPRSLSAGRKASRLMTRTERSLAGLRR